VSGVRHESIGIAGLLLLELRRRRVSIDEQVGSVLWSITISIGCRISKPNDDANDREDDEHHSVLRPPCYSWRMLHIARACWCVKSAVRGSACASAWEQRGKLSVEVRTTQQRGRERGTTKQPEQQMRWTERARERWMRRSNESSPLLESSLLLFRAEGAPTGTERGRSGCLSISGISRLLASLSLPLSQSPSASSSPASLLGSWWWYCGGGWWYCGWRLATCAREIGGLYRRRLEGSLSLVRWFFRSLVWSEALNSLFHRHRHPQYGCRFC